MRTLPEMFVEKRDVDQTHGLKAPIMPWDEGYEQQLQSYMILLEGAKVHGWSEEVIQELVRFLPESLNMFDIPMLAEEFACNLYPLLDRQDITFFVKDDECIEFFVLLKKWINKNGIKEKESKGFIDGTGTGHYERYLDRLNRKGKSLGTLEKAFDAKWTFKMERPIIELGKRAGIDMTSCMNYMHPWHWAYPAWHGAKFFEAVDYVLDAYEVDEMQRKKLIVIAYVYSMWRTGWGVHLPQDNYASAYLAGIKEFNFMWA